MKDSLLSPLLMVISVLEVSILVSKENRVGRGAQSESRIGPVPFASSALRGQQRRLSLVRPSLRVWIAVVSLLDQTV
jgi:hypothetical protein